MKILWFSHLVPYPPKGGVLQRSYNLLRQAALKQEVHLVALIQPELVRSHFPSVDEGLAESRRNLEELCEVVEFVDIGPIASKWAKRRTAAASLLSTRPYSMKWLESLRAKQLLSGLGEFDCAYVGTIGLDGYRDALPAARLVLDHHNIESHMMLRRVRKEGNPFAKAYYALESFKLRRAEARACAAYDVNLVCSELDGDRLQSVSSQAKTEVIPNGVDLEYFKRRQPLRSGGPLVFAGGLTWYPNLDAMHYFLEEVWPLIRRERPDCRFNLIGRGASDRIRDLADKDSNINLLGFVDDVRPYMEEASVYVCPIRDGGGTKLKMLDAMAMGVPMVCDPIAAEGLGMENGVHALMGSTAERFAAAVLRLLDSPEEAGRLSLEAQQHVRSNFDYDLIGGRLNRLVFEGK